jgi:hypothetical protein
MFHLYWVLAEYGNLKLVSGAEKFGRAATAV